MALPSLPIGIQSFRELRRLGNLYVDKTRHIHAMIQVGKYHFLSRPRRFGKSLLVTTLAELFKGNRKLFKGLWIEDRWDWQQQYPVIHLFFNDASYHDIGLEGYISQELQKHATEYQIQLSQATTTGQFRELIEQLSAKYGQVVLLVDEYDKPIIDFLDDVPKAEEHRDIMKKFYSVLKPLDDHLRFVFITGVSKFSRVSIFSELNNLFDLTLHPDFSNLIGITQRELEHYFAGFIDKWTPKYGSKAALLEKMAEWYNGYSWGGEDRVYNPWSVMNFCNRGQFRNFWFAGATPTFLVKVLDRSRTYNLESVQVGEAVMGSFDLGKINAYALLFQTGYLTIKAEDDFGFYTFGYPNREVRHSLLQYLLAEVVHEDVEVAPVHVRDMTEAMQTHNPAQFIASLNALFATIPYQIFIADKEAYYHMVTFLALSMMGTFVQAEPSQAQGRPDCIVQLPEAVYIIEFKLDQSAEAAIEQIKAQQYAQPYQSSGKPIYLFGINFSSTQKTVNGWLVEEAMH